MICQHFQSKLNGIMTALEYKEKPRLEENHFRHTKQLRKYDGDEKEMGKVEEDYENRSSSGIRTMHLSLQRDRNLQAPMEYILQKH